MDRLRLFAAAFNPPGEYGVECGIVFARDFDEALRMFRESDEMNAIEEDHLREIPIDLGYHYIGGYCE